MAEPVTINLRHVARGLGIPLGQVQVVVELLDDGNTVPFITRYRKDQTGGLDEEQIRQVQARLAKLRLLAERKQTILRSIESQGKLTEGLSRQIRAAGTAKRLEDLYLPYRPRKQTLAATARARGLEPLAAEILGADPSCADLDARAADFVYPDRQVPTAADALLGAGHILAEQFSERADLRGRLREILYRSGKLVSSQVGGSKAAPEKIARRESPEPAGRSAEAPSPPIPTGQSSEPPPPPERAPGSQPAADTTRSQPEGEATGSQPEAGPVETSQAEPEQPANPQTEGHQAKEAGSPGEAKPPSPDEAKAPSPDEAKAPSPDEDRRAGACIQAEAKPPSAEAKPSSPDEIEPPATLLGPIETAGKSEAGAEAHREPPPGEQAEKSAHAPSAVQPARAAVQRTSGKRESKKKKKEQKREKAFADYFDYSEEIKRIPPHRILAINRGERAKVLRVRIEADQEAIEQAIDELCVPDGHPHAQFLRGCARDALGRLILPSLEREVRRDLTERAEAHAVGVFARNLRNLLLQPPIRDRRVLAVDPGYRSGCKLAALDQFGNVLAHGVIYLVGRPQRKQEAQRVVTELVDRFQLKVVAIGNGTACREAEDFFARLIAGELKDRGVAYVIVNEAGASVYSTSRLSREEFPNYDASLRGAISIGRRLQDPLSELVKIEPANIGVGLYQHDVKAKHLRASLDEMVESCVNYVGVDVNTASPALLRYVSGLNQLTARRLYEHRLRNGPFRNREQLREVPGFGEATFVQAAGFLKITGGDNPLDASWIHPESYEAASRLMAELGFALDDPDRKQEAESAAKRMTQDQATALAKRVEAGQLLLKDLLAQLARPGRDPREDLPGPVFKQGVLKLDDLSVGMELTGTVLNVVDFGAFVDIGMHDSGLVHVSQLADRFVRDPHDVIAVGDIVQVWVLEVDKERRRVSLTRIPPGAKRSRPRRDGKGPGRRRPERADGPRPEGKPRPQKPPRSKARGPARPRHRPKSRPRPMVPITDKMIAGKEPMRSFSDLVQFFEVKEGDSPKAGQKAKPKHRDTKPSTPERRPPGTEHKPQAPAFGEGGAMGGSSGEGGAMGGPPAEGGATGGSPAEGGATGGSSFKGGATGGSSALASSGETETTEEQTQREPNPPAASDQNASSPSSAPESRPKDTEPPSPPPEAGPHRTHDNAQADRGEGGHANP